MLAWMADASGWPAVSQEADHLIRAGRVALVGQESPR
jgi:hypothetical protein